MAGTGDKFCALCRPSQSCLFLIYVQGFVTDFTSCLTPSSLRIISLLAEVSFSHAVKPQGDCPLISQVPPKRSDFQKCTWLRLKPKTPLEIKINALNK